MKTLIKNCRYVIVFLLLQVLIFAGFSCYCVSIGGNWWNAFDSFNLSLSSTYPIFLVLGVFCLFGSWHGKIKFFRGKDRIWINGYQSELARGWRILLFVVALFVIGGWCFDNITLDLSGEPYIKEIKYANANEVAPNKLDSYFEENTEYYVKNMELVCQIPRNAYEAQFGTSIGGGRRYLVRFKNSMGYYVYTGLWTDIDDEIDQKCYSALKSSGFYIGKVRLSGCFHAYDVEENNHYLEYAYEMYSNSLTDNMLNMVFSFDEEYQDLNDYVVKTEESNRNRLLSHKIDKAGGIISIVLILMLIPMCSIIDRFDVIGDSFVSGHALFEKCFEKHNIVATHVHYYDDLDRFRTNKLKEFCFEDVRKGEHFVVYLRKTTLGYRAFAALSIRPISLNFSERNIKKIYKKYDGKIIMADRLLSEKEVAYLQEIALEVEKNKAEDANYMNNNDQMFCYRMWNNKLSYNYEEKWESFAKAVFGMAIYGTNYSIE